MTPEYAQWNIQNITDQIDPSISLGKGLRQNRLVVKVRQSPLVLTILFVKLHT
jgi:hypothetical protein